MTTSSFRQTVHVDLADRSYDIVIGASLLAESNQFLSLWLTRHFERLQNPSVFIISDSNTQHFAETLQSHLRGDGWRSATYAFESGEQSKRLETISVAWDQLVEFKADRRTVVIAVGGGVVGDAAGFVAATFARGIPFVQIPTTLLSAVDSSVGGKVGINHPKAKNLIGAFHQPIGVLIDTETLSTLPDREYRSGLAEVVKYGVILDEEFFAYLQQNVSALNDRDASVLQVAIARSCQLKAQVVEQDEYETTGLRAVLNYGHTFCHAFEALTHYGELLHGEAVSMGMVYASRLAEKLGRVNPRVTQQQIDLLEQLNLPLNLNEPAKIRVDDVIDRMKLDKKTVGGKLRFILPTRIGHVELVNDVAEDLVREILVEGGLS